MARTIPADRFLAVVAAAAGVFITHGYQRTQVQDVADALGPAKGTMSDLNLATISIRCSATAS